MERLSIITPVSRPENLRAIKANIEQMAMPFFNITWYCIYDPGKQFAIMDFKESWIISATAGTPDDCGGGSQRNAALDRITDGWVLFLDDDNKLHPEFSKSMANLVKWFSNSLLFIFNQDAQDRPGRSNHFASIANIKKGHIDMAQVMIKHEAVSRSRFLINEYNCDFYFIEEVYSNVAGKTFFIDEFLCYYNALR